MADVSAREQTAARLSRLPISVRNAAYQLRVIHLDGACAESMENAVLALLAEVEQLREQVTVTAKHAAALEYARLELKRVVEQQTAALREMTEALEAIVDGSDWERRSDAYWQVRKFAAAVLKDQAALRAGAE